MLTAILVVSVILPFPGQPCQLMTRLKGTDDLSHSPQRAASFSTCVEVS